MNNSETHFGYFLIGIVALLIIGAFVGGLYDLANTSLLTVLFVTMITDISIVTVNSFVQLDRFTTLLFGIAAFIFALSFIGGTAGFTVGLLEFITIQFTGLPANTLTTLIFRYAITIITRAV
jgi:hypothetical protein